MTDLSDPASPELSPDLLGDLPERLIKHSVRYADHQAVDRAALTPMMRHYVELKDQ